MALICTQPPLLEPVALSELKDMLRVDFGDTSQDDVIYSLGVAARGYCETVLERKAVQQSWSLLLDFFPGYIDLKLNGTKISTPFVSGANALLAGLRFGITLPFPPVQAISAFTYIDANGAVTDMFNGDPGDPAAWSFVEDLESQPARLVPLFGQFWPIAQVIPNAVTVNMTVGFATPITVTATNSATIASSFSFTNGNVGQPISIPGAGVNGGALNTIVQSQSSGAATLRDAPLANVTGPALLVNYGSPSHWELLRAAIKFLVNSWFVNRMPSFDAATRDCIRGILSPAMDKRL